LNLGILTESRTIFPLCLPLVFLLLVFSCVADEATYEDGKVMFNNREYALAIPYYERIVKKNGKAEIDAKAAYYLAESYFQLEKYDKSSPLYRNYLVNFPSHDLRSKAQFRFSESLYFQEEYETAARAFERFIQDNPKDPLVPESLYRSATSLLEVGRSSEASQLLSRLKKDFPKHPKVEEALYFMAWADFRDDRFVEAAEGFYQFFKKFPHSDKAIESLLRSANAYFSAKQFRKALELYNDVLRQGQGAFKKDSNTGIAWSYYKLNEFDKAGNYFLTLARNAESKDSKAEQYYQAIHSYYSGEAWSKGIEVANEFVKNGEGHDLLGDAYYWRGLIHIQKKSYSEAEKDLLKATEFKKTKITQGEIYLELGNLYIKQDKHAEAVEMLKKGLGKAKKTDVLNQLRYEISRVLHLLGRTEEAISFMEDNLKTINASEGEMALLSQFSMAEFQFSKKEYAQALGYYESSFKEGGEDLKLDALYKIGWCHRFLKDLTKAYASFDKLYKLEKKSKIKYGQEIPFLMAQLLQEKKDLVQARKYYKDVISFNKGYAPESILALAELEFEVGDFKQVVKLLKGFLVSFRRHSLLSNVHFLLAESAYEINDVKLAKSSYRSVIVSKASAAPREDALYGSSWLLYENNESEQALKDINLLLKDFPETAYKESAIQLKGKILRQLNRLEEAKTFLSSGISAMDKGNGEAIILDLAKIETELNNPDKALELYNKLLSDFPNTELRGMVTYEKGWLYMGMDKPNEAFLMFKAYERSNPQGEFIHDVEYVMGELAYSKSKFADAISYYEKSKSIERYKDRSFYKMAWSYLELDNPKAAAETFATLVKDCPESSLNIESMYREGQAWLQALDFEKAQQSLSLYVERGKQDPFFGDALCDLGRVYEKQGLVDKALDIYSNYTTLFPKGEQISEVSFRIAMLNIQSEKYAEARSFLKSTLSVLSHPLAPEAQYREGECFFLEERYNEAIGAFLKTEKYGFGEEWQAAALFKIAQSHRMLQNTNRAKEYLERLMSRFPKSEYISKAMEELRKLN